MSTPDGDTHARFHRRVGSVRPSHLMFTSGIGALLDLPNFSVLMSGIDEWNHENAPWHPLIEPRLLDAVRKILGPTVNELRPPPWLDGTDVDPTGIPARVGVPVQPFPNWLRCTACNQLAGLDAHQWGFENDKPRRPHEARFFHKDCPRKKGRRPLAVAARFVLACTRGHLDDFPYAHFVHRGGECRKVALPTLKMLDIGGNLGVNVRIECANCEDYRNIRDAMGKRGEENLPACRGRHPHLRTFAQTGCPAPVKMLVVGASNQWFPQTLTALAVPRRGASALQAEVDRLWDDFLQHVTLPVVLDAYLKMPGSQLDVLRRWSADDILRAINDRRTAPAPAGVTEAKYPDLLTPEWDAFTTLPAPETSTDFALRRDESGVPEALAGLFSDVVQVERLREVRALIGFTRLDAPDPDDPDLVLRAPISRNKIPHWVPASEVRGEGIFLRLPEDLVADWESRVKGSPVLHEHREAFKRFRHNRYSDRLPVAFDPAAGWPGPRYIALHTLSHLLIRMISLECGYSSASLSERIYAEDRTNPRAGILIYTAVPDAEGTLGGLASLAEPAELERIVRRALHDALRCSSDPLCAERLPRAPSDFLHGAACHACLFVSETTCERGNRFLDRRFVVPVDNPELVLVVMRH